MAIESRQLSAKRKTRRHAQSDYAAKPKNTKKAQILALYSSGITDVAELSELTNSRPSYAASVLQDSGLLTGYFDLYTRSKETMNVYSKFFSNKLGFKNIETARRSVALIDQMYRQFKTEQDRAGQHHAMATALTLYDRARWSGKRDEGELFRQWLVKKLYETDPAH